MKQIGILALCIFSGFLDAQRFNKPVVVAVIDSAINTSLPVLKDNLTAGQNFLAHSNMAPDHDDHGTAVAGIIVKIAPHVVIVPIAVTHGGVSSREALAKALVYAFDRGVHVINLSLGIDEEALIRAREQIGPERFNNVLLVIAAGNAPLRYPAFTQSWPNVVSVGALSLRDTCSLTSYSAYGPHVDIAAPAGDAGDGLQTYGFFGQPRKFNGTSAAVPVVVGLAARIKSEQISSDGAFLKQSILSHSRFCRGAAISNGRAIGSELLPPTLF